MKVDQAIILAAGRGSRLGALGADQPKCLLPVDGMTLLDRNLAALRACDVSQVLLVGGWQAHRLAGRDCEHTINPRWHDTQMVRSLQQADGWLRRAPALIMYGDCGYRADTLAKVLQAPTVDLLIPGDRDWRALWALRFEHPLDDAETWRSQQGRLLEIGLRRPDAGEDAYQAQFMGLLRITPSAWQRISQHLCAWEDEEGADAIDRMDMTTLLRRLLGAGEAIASLEVNGGWIEIDTADDLAAIEQAMQWGDFSHDIRY